MPDHAVHQLPVPVPEDQPLSVSQQQNTSSIPHRHHALPTENDSNPRSEQPSVPDALSAQLLTQLQPLDPEPSYFSPQPLRHYSSQFPHHATASSHPPCAIGTITLAAESSAPQPRPMDEHASACPTPPQRPMIHRDASSTSTASNATVRANSLDPIHKYAASSRRDGPVYPNQSYAALHLQQHPTAHAPSIVRSRTTHPNVSHHPVSSLSSLAFLGMSDEHYKDAIESGPRTVGNSPVSSPGLFDLAQRRSQDLDPSDDSLHVTPWLHYTHRQPPKETHVADIQKDPATRRKIINQYEIVDELGRGVHGKVKLGRDCQNGKYVAIKIVDRYSKRRRLGKSNSHEDKIKREIAILKKARHPNIVSLLEVIDDPQAKKVYIVLEHVELGEVKWRTEGAREICLVEWRRFQRESSGIFDNDSDIDEDERIIRLAHQKLAQQQRRVAREASLRHPACMPDEPWSLEFGIDSEDEYSDAGWSRSSHGANDRPLARAYSGNKHDPPSQHEATMETAIRSPSPGLHTELRDAAHELGGIMARDGNPLRGRAPSVAASASSGFTDAEEEIPEHFQWVPLMTIQAAWEAFKDTVLGIEYLHYQKVIHRDIKPANLLVTKDRRIKISDFGVSYLGRQKTEESNGLESESEYQDNEEAIELAKTVGTPAFYAPELCRTDGEEETTTIDGAIDVWALGVTLYCLVYGRVPFHHANTYSLMKVISEEEPYIPRFRLKPVAEQSNSRPSSHGRHSRPMLGNRKAAHDFEYEEVDENLRDLLRRLLVKEARYRITIPEIKRHPWVLSGISNYESWVEETDPSMRYDGRRIEISTQDVETAVVPAGVFDRIRSIYKKGSELFRSTNRNTSSRRRAKSSVVGGELPPPISTTSSSSTISQEGRRGSLAPGAILEVIGRSREAEHPLAHSVTASPEARDRSRYFDSPGSRTTSPALPPENNRPLMPERASSSIHTIRQSDLLQGRHDLPAVLPALPGTPTALDSPGGSHLSGLFGGLPRRVVNSMRSRDKLRPHREHMRAKSIDRLIIGDDDPHGMPSLAISNTTASGHVDQPEALRDLHSGRRASPSISEPYPPNAFETNSRQSSMSSLSSRLHHNWAVTRELESGPSLTLPCECRPEYPLARSVPTRPSQELDTARGTFHPIVHARDSSEHRSHRSTDERGLRRVRENSWYRDRPASATLPRPPSSLSHFTCPPEFDAEAALFQRQRLNEYLDSDNLSSENSPVCDQNRGLAFSSSEEQFTPMSQSASNPSIPSVMSADSLFPDECAPRDRAGGVAFAASGESIDRYDVPVDDAAGYDGDHALESPGDDESGEDDVGLFIGRNRKQLPSKPKQSNVVGPDLRPRRRSARSGSNGTVKKMPPPEDGTEEHKTVTMQQ